MDATPQILERFEQISAIPRGTKREEQISRWLQAWAKADGYPARTDQAGNLVIQVPAGPGFESAPTVILQGHMDMVCEKTSDSGHDFTRDPLHILREGDWLRADRTTLGADNGIAIAIAMVVAEHALHPPLELLFTVEEEVGLVGASSLDPGLLSGKILINLDSEEEASFVVGCAGGRTTFIRVPVSRQALQPAEAVFHLAVGGLQGGHSGADIHRNRASASKILARALDRIGQAAAIRLVELKAGTARNVIARQAEAVFAVPEASAALCREHLMDFDRNVTAEYSGTDAGLTVTLVPQEVSAGAGAAAPATTIRIVQLVMALPHGVIHMSSAIEGFVETSVNLAMAELREDGLYVTSNQRSTVMSRLDEINRRVEAVARLAGAEVTHTEGYPAWQPDRSSELLERSVGIYESLLGRKPEVKMIHAGLECGIIGSRCGGLDMISLGPTIRGAHSPDEMLHIPSVGRVWRLLEALLHSYADR